MVEESLSYVTSRLSTDMTATFGKTSKLQLWKPHDLELPLEMEDERDRRVCEMACRQGPPLELVPYSKLPNTLSRNQ